MLIGACNPTMCPVRAFRYEYCFRSYTKKRWLNRELLEVFASEFHSETPAHYAAAIRAGMITVNGKTVGTDTQLRDNDLILNTVHRHEPPVYANQPRVFFLQFFSSSIWTDPLSPISQLQDATPHAPCEHALLRDGTDRVLTGAFNPMLWPIRLFRTDQVCTLPLSNRVHAVLRQSGCGSLVVAVLLLPGCAVYAGVL